MATELKDGQIWKWSAKEHADLPQFKISKIGCYWLCQYPAGYEDIVEDYECLANEILTEAELVCPATLPAPMSTGYRAAEWLRKVAETLEQKSVSYGDSVGKPLRIFSSAEVTEGIRVRIDDKLSRIARGGRWPGEDVVVDLVGYLALLAVTEDKK